MKIDEFQKLITEILKIYRKDLDETDKILFDTLSNPEIGIRLEDLLSSLAIPLAPDFGNTINQLDTVAKEDLRQEILYYLQSQQILPITRGPGRKALSKNPPQKEELSGNLVKAVNLVKKLCHETKEKNGITSEDVNILRKDEELIQPHLNESSERSFVKFINLALLQEGIEPVAGRLGGYRQIVVANKDDVQSDVPEQPQVEEMQLREREKKKEIEEEAADIVRAEIQKNLREKNLYPGVQKYFESLFNKSHFCNVIITGGNYRLPGQWSTPDVTSLIIEKFDNIMQVRARVITCEVKLELDLVGVAEAESHSRKVHQTYIMTPQRFKDVDPECKDLLVTKGIGLLCLTESREIKEYIDARRLTPSDEAVDEFISKIFKGEVHRDFQRSYVRAIESIFCKIKTY
jgi:hypothetical protein